MKNLFGFSYETKNIKNLDDTDSRFSIIYGKDGNVIHTKKTTYKIIPTEDVSAIGQAFVKTGLKVNTFNHKHGETIGLNIELIKNKKTAIGQKSYNAVITVPNNGSGKGYLSIHECRLICLNGMTRSRIGYKEVSLKIPHTVEYSDALNVMQEAIVSFQELVTHMEKFDASLNDQVVKKKYVAMRHLNKWFYDMELCIEFKENMSFDDFRKMLVESPEDIPLKSRYDELKAAFERELEYNKELNLPLSMYTIFASVTNFLSRRNESSKSAAPAELIEIRQSKKLQHFEKIAF